MHEALSLIRNLLVSCSEQILAFHFLLIQRKAAQSRDSSSWPCEWGKWVGSQSVSKDQLKDVLLLQSEKGEKQFRSQFLKISPLASLSKLFEDEGWNEFLFWCSYKESWMKDYLVWEHYPVKKYSQMNAVEWPANCGCGKTVTWQTFPISDIKYLIYLIH